VDVAPSQIPNSGYGAFLTFLGARHRKIEADRKDTNTAKSTKEELCPAGKDGLHAMGEDGFGMHVELVGEVAQDMKMERPRGFGPNRIFEESDFEEEPSPTTEFSRRGEGNGLIRKCAAAIGSDPSFLAPLVRIVNLKSHAATLNVMFTLLRSRQVRPISKGRQKTNVTFQREELHL